MPDTESVQCLDIPYQNLPENVKLGTRIKEIYFLNKLSELSYMRTRESLSKEPYSPGSWGSTVNVESSKRKLLALGFCLAIKL